MSITKPYKTYRFLNRGRDSGGGLEGGCHAGGPPDGAASGGGAAVLTNAAPQVAQNFASGGLSPPQFIQNFWSRRCGFDGGT